MNIPLLLLILFSELGRHGWRCWICGGGASRELGYYMMQPAEIAHSYDSIAQQWLQPHLDINGIRQHERALKFRSGSGLALDVGCGCNGRFMRLLASHGRLAGWTILRKSGILRWAHRFISSPSAF